MTPKQIAAIALLPYLKKIKGFDEDDFYYSISSYRNELGILIVDNSYCIYYNLKNYVYVDWTYADTFRAKRLGLEFLKSFNKPIKFQLANKNFCSNHCSHIQARYYWLNPKDI